MTFDPVTPKIQTKYYPPRIHPHTKFDVKPPHNSSDIDKNKTGRMYGRTTQKHNASGHFVGGGIKSVLSLGYYGSPKLQDNLLISEIIRITVLH